MKITDETILYIYIEVLYASEEDKKNNWTEQDLREFLEGNDEEFDATYEDEYISVGMELDQPTEWMEYAVDAMRRYSHRIKELSFIKEDGVGWTLR